MVSGQRESVAFNQATLPDLVSLFSGRLRRWRQARSMPLKRMAADLGVSVSVVSAWEQGSRFPSVHHLEKLAVYTGMPVCQLLFAGAQDCPRAKQTSRLNGTG